MYGYDWKTENGIVRLSISGKCADELRPVFKEELDYFGFNKHWSYPDTDKPLLWAKNVRTYVLNGESVAFDAILINWTQKTEQGGIIKDTGEQEKC